VPADTKRFLRYLAPNAVTATSMMFGLVSLVATHRGVWELAAWMIIYAVLTDRLDGFVARAVRGTSEFGMQLDSFADFLNFGVAPAFLVYTFLTSHPAPELQVAQSGWLHASLVFACAVWVLGAVFRLARFNVISDDKIPTKIFFGIPTTLAGGLLAIWFLALLKYAQPGPATFGGPKLLGEGWTVPVGVWLWFPLGMVLGAYMMASSLRMPKVGAASNRAATAFVLVNVLLGYGLGFARLWPEFLVISPTLWITVFLVWGQVAARARDLRPPRLFPPSTDAQPKVRPQEDLGPDDE
jgi:CDP-diacylglycerol--serine O-phosphatidyltransferase